jgi:hypothetical protein
VCVVDPEHPEDSPQGDRAGHERYPTISITTKFETLLVPVEQRLRAKLAEARAETDHAVTIGSKLEAAVRKELRGFLPPGFGVGNGFIYDSYGDGTKQTDLIITNPDNPLSYPDDQPGSYVVDGVSVAGEVKAVLTTGELDDCIAKGTRHKQLRMTFNPADKFTEPVHLEHALRTGCTPAFIVVAFENKIAMQTLVQRLDAAPLVPPPAGKEFDDGRGNDPQPPIDAVCLLDRGVVWRADATDRLPLRPYIDGKPYVGWFAAGTTAPLLVTLAWLHSMMMLRVRRGASVFVPYLTPYPKQAAYMANKVSFPQPEAEEAESQ